MLEGKTILITGSARGIGKATAQRAKAYGADVILHGKTASEHLQALAKELKSNWIACDVGDQQAVRANCESVLKRKGKLDALVCNAGFFSHKPFLDLQE